MYILLLYRSFYGSKKSNVKEIDVSLVSDDELEVSSSDQDELTAIVESEIEEETQESKTECENITDCKTEEEATVSVEIAQNTVVATKNNGENKKQNKKADIQWNKTKWIVPRETNIEEKKLVPKIETLKTRSSPMQFFREFVDDGILEHITFQTNLYATQQSQRKGSKQIKPFSRNEIEKAIGIILLMGIHKLPNRRMHWANLSKVPVISQAMTRNRFEDILQYLHYNDNTVDLNHSDSNFNKLFKLQPLIDHFRSKFKYVVEPETFMSIDEMMLLLRVDILQRCTCLKNQQNRGINFGAGQEFQGIFMILKWWMLEILKAPLLP